MISLLKKFVADERGLETVEYALMAGAFLILVLVGIEYLGGKVTDSMSATGDFLHPGA